MNNSARSRRESRRRGCRRNRRQRGGNTGASYTFGASVDPKNPGLGNAAEVIRFPSCGNATAPGFISSYSPKGLPGFGGGRRRRGTRKQRGGRYTNTFEVVGDAKIALTNPVYTGCGDGMLAAQNPLNKGSINTLLTAPPPLAPLPTPMKGGRRTRRRSQWGGVGGVDSMVYEAPRAGYTTTPSNSSGGNAGTLADGKVPFLVNVPYSAKPEITSSCLKTGGGRKRSRKQKRKGRKSRKTQRRRRN